jgi:hypothetical protein
MKIVLENVPFPYDLGCKILKLKGGDCPFEQLEDIWNDIVPLTFSEIAQLQNLEQRRIAVNHLGIDTLVKSIDAKLINTETLSKTTTWINEKGVKETIEFEDTYELYQVNGEQLFGNDINNWQSNNNYYYVRCKDTSTDREYLIWVKLDDVFRTNGGGWCNHQELPNRVNSIQAIAWTITTDIPKGYIEKIIRQGDCVLIKPTNDYFLDKNIDKDKTRHLTEEEYKTLLEVES